MKIVSKCRIIIYFANKTNTDFLKSYLNKIPNSQDIVTNDILIRDLLKNNSNIKLINEIIPDFGPISFEVYDKVKEKFSKFERILSNIIIDNIEVIKGLDYYILKQLLIFSTFERILESKKDQIFLLEGFHPVYELLPGLLKNMKYEFKNIELIMDDKIKDCTEKDLLELKKNISKNKISKFLRSLKGNKKNVIGSKKFVKKIIIYGINLIRQKTINSNSQKIEKDIIKNIESKIKNYGEVQFFFLITATRLDMYLRSWNPVLMKLKMENIPFVVITSDLATTISLENEKIKHVSIFQEVNMLKNILKSNKQGIELKEKLIKIKKELPIEYNNLLNDIEDKLFRTLALGKILNQLLKQNQTKGVISMQDGEMLESVGSQIAKTKNIDSYTMLTTTYGEVPIFMDCFHSDKIFVYGTHGKKILENLKYNSTQIFLTGNPKYDYISKMEVNESKKWLEEKYNIKTEIKIITIGMSRWHDKDHEWIKKLIHFCNKNNYFLVIKVHPLYKTTSTEKSDINIQKIKNECSMAKILILYDTNIEELLAASDLIITDYSNFGIEAMLMNKPIISFNFTKEDWGDHPQRLDQLNAATYIDQYEELEKEINNIFENYNKGYSLKENNIEIIRKFNFENDGNACNRIYRYLTEKN
jgi:hypothetical protein